MKPFWKPYAHHHHSDRYFQKCRKWVLASSWQVGADITTILDTDSGILVRERDVMLQCCYGDWWWLGWCRAAIFTSQRHWAVADNTLPKGYLCHGEAGGRDPPPQSTSVQTGGTSLQNIFECRQIFKYLWQTVTIPNGLEGPRTSLESLSVLTLWH